MLRTVSDTYDSSVILSEHITPNYNPNGEAKVSVYINDSKYGKGSIVLRNY